LDVIGLSSGQEINMARIAEDSGVPPRTVANFIEFLQDTLLAFQLLPFEKTKKRKASTKSKIYLFDVGVANYLSGRKKLLPKSDAFGYAFEHFVIQEVRALLSYQKCDEPLYYWRSKDYEVDLIINHPDWGLTAIEIKSRDQIQDRHLKGLKALGEENIIKRFIIVSCDPISRKIDGIECLHYTTFFSCFNFQK
jgi:predicted AAA+ superfamily ATPase